MKIKIIVSLIMLSLTSCSTDVSSILSTISKTVQDTNKSKEPISNEIDKKVSPTPTPEPKETPKVDNIVDEKKQIQELHNNIKIFKDMVEKYSDKRDGFYPENVSELYSNALINNYWTDLKNPYTLKSGVGIGGAYYDMKQYKNYTTQSSLKGLIIYEPIECKDTKGICNYNLYGTDKNGALLQ